MKINPNHAWMAALLFANVHCANDKPLPPQKSSSKPPVLGESKPKPKPKPPVEAPVKEAVTLAVEPKIKSQLEAPPKPKVSAEENGTQGKQRTRKPRRIQDPQYEWLDKYRAQDSIAVQIPLPQGYERVGVQKGSFSQWLRHLQLAPRATPVMLYNKTVKPYQAGAFRVVDIDIGNEDLQQCADALMRLRAEYLYSLRDYPSIRFNYTSGDTIRFSDWAVGIKPVVVKNKVSFTKAAKTSDYSYKNFRKYMRSIFYYAGTASLSRELKRQNIANIKAGDVFIKGGFPGHAVFVVDVAKNVKTGKKIFLLAQSYMPAQSIHILRNFNQEDLSPWYPEDFGDKLKTPEWTFKKSSLKRF